MSFAILIFFLGIGTAIVAGLITMLFYKQKNYFLDIFKPGFLAGSIGILFILIIGYFFETDSTKVFNFDLFWLAPIVLTCIGLSIGTIQIYRKKQNNIKP